MPNEGVQPLKVLIVDDSAFNRRSIAEILSTSPSIEIVGRAADGEEALRMVSSLKPDVITLDLEMPKMDGFTFLRILMSRTPVSVIVISSYSQKENVFKALELGALDFVAKPDRYIDPELKSVREELLRKVELARSVRVSTPTRREPLASAPVQKTHSGLAPQNIVAIAASTGGPSALLELFSRLPTKYPHAIVVAQHMPESFTRTFAERLDRRSPLAVSEAKDGDMLEAGTAFVCPGRQCLEVEASARGTKIRLRAPEPEDRYVPSADAMLQSVARVAGNRAVAVVLTGMGDDGARGAKSIVDAGGTVVVESEATAVVYGMPGAVVRSKLASRSLPLPDLALWLAGL
ncbi:MAG TPA: chemotaxis response regulator protein-glutamate methylesterase [Polyangiaceae bacterium]|nr:chemotaxis response regulator protein-glutamate methylesterase [Polyangiaceae bacterium]